MHNGSFNTFKKVLSTMIFNHFLAWRMWHLNQTLYAMNYHQIFSLFSKLFYLQLMKQKLGLCSAVQFKCQSPFLIGPQDEWSIQNDHLIGFLRMMRKRGRRKTSLEKPLFAIQIYFWILLAFFPLGVDSLGIHKVRCNEGTVRSEAYKVKMQKGALLSWNYIWQGDGWMINSHQRETILWPFVYLHIYLF